MVDVEYCNLKVKIAEQFVHTNVFQDSFKTFLVRRFIFVLLLCFHIFGVNYIR